MCTEWQIRLRDISAKIGCNYQNSCRNKCRWINHICTFSEHVTHCRLMKTAFLALTVGSETDHPPSSSAFMAQTGSACLRGWPSPKPEVYTASGSVQIKTVIIDLGLDSALFEKVGEAGGVGWCHLWFRAHSLGSQRWCCLLRMRENETERKKDGVSVCTLNRSKWNWQGLLSGWLWVYMCLCETLHVSAAML